VRYLKFFQTNSQKIFSYNIADTDYISDLPIACLEGFYNGNTEISENEDFLNLSKPVMNSTVFHDQALIGENSYSLTIKSSDTAEYFLKSEMQEFQIANNLIQSKQTTIDDTLLMGPVLILNLALNSVFCLHASAFLIKNKLFILMGDSGTGKSTIARFMAEQSQCQRIADDILPIKIDENTLQILPNFPQLKLPTSLQYKGGNLEQDTILLFAQKSIGKTKLTPVDSFSSIKKLINHSVATKLFAVKELQNHLSFCHKTSTLVKSYQLNYQHSSDSLKQLYNLLYELV
jgi:hypothetical protein